MIKNLLLISMLACSLQAETITGTCKRVLDGDTLLLTDGTTVQIWGIDAPEKGQDYADKARNHLEKLTKGRKLTIEVKDTDQYGRVVGEVKAGGKDVAHSMVRTGMAWHDDYNAPEAGDLKKAMMAARKAGKGLWADESPVRPYDFRKGKTTPAPRVEVAADEVLCEYVMDGDTFKSGDTRVRLWGIDAPEKGQPYADKARARLKELIEGKAVRLEWKDRDQYSREVAIVYAGSTNINLQMVKEGLAWHYEYFAPDAEDLAAAEKAARKKRKGLWADDEPVNPYEFRKRNREK
ncbi:MAG: hypothetical protein E7032_09065 [Akkermansiaceae bacterium]|nr:hypothetical protein [Akkermansiaceae bacterium]